ncbi:restriction endonuclease subunit S [Escherichia coli]|uniref:restriction endonuclease subunit S n=1 Tax=Escherichia coli TaxID=562 RepID=UPI001F12DCAE|nr:restriction endonuclease subunit S [Escherichia coli]MCQ7039199.1 restriction endonuclease subunit S [Salmonella enterica]MCH6354985.1 restriction endonuclease subunit S [Escherichia coli]MDP4020332.1 restriction endonuclease subunit S [Escherichia coli]MDW4571067.1 restriction endonuclease subunit S [Escherichia coli]WMO30015.1 restriction endonuclease subunit S [Escherichia coli]
MERLALMPKYEDYVDSGVEWLGDLPSHWDAVKMKFLFKDTSMKNKPNETLLSVTQSQGVVPREWVENRMVMPSGNLESFKFIAKGDFAISLRSFEGGLEYCHHDGIISPAYTVLKTKKDYLLAGYYKYLFKSQTFISELQTSIVGIREGKNISYEELQYSLLPIPAEEEQTRIANFLDKKTALIDEAISIKEQQISLLKERKQIIIQQAVTQGLDPNVPMKDSGVDWIGKIPAHWDIVPGFTVFKEGKDSNKGMIESQVLSLSYGNVIIKPEEKLVGLVPESFETYQIALPGDIIIRCTDLQNDKTSLRTGIVRNKGIITSAYLNLRLKTEHSAEFMHYFLHALDITKTIYRFGSGLRQNLSYKDFKHMRILMPPKAEQIEIVNYINNQVEVTESSIDLIKNKIEKLKEYKTTLINSAVTGKIKITPEMVEQ